MTAFETGTPSIRQIQKFIKEKTDIQIKLVTNDILVGQIRWQDPDCICLVSSENKEITIWRLAIVYMHAK
jgi:host factor-I protein